MRLFVAQDILEIRHCWPPVLYFTSMMGSRNCIGEIQDSGYKILNINKIYKIKECGYDSSNYELPYVKILTIFKLFLQYYE